MLLYAEDDQSVIAKIYVTRLADERGRRGDSTRFERCDRCGRPVVIWPAVQTLVKLWGRDNVEIICNHHMNGTRRSKRR